MTNTYDALALFSGGLDSILAMRVVQAQGLKILGLHFVTPFFGYPEKVEYWRDTFGVEVTAVDISAGYVAQVLKHSKRGLGKFLNPCIDCHAYMARTTVELMPQYGAKFLISGEVLGQRPMSQRKDAMDQVVKDAEAKGLLVRPLCAKHMAPTAPELDGTLDRDKLKDFKGRGRKDQLALAREFGFAEADLPTPAGGCKLTEAQPSSRYLRLLMEKPDATAEDFHLVGMGRTYWAGRHWLTVGRNKDDNDALSRALDENDLAFDLRDYPSPLAVGRPLPGHPWSEEAIADAAAFVASFSTKARQAAEGGDAVTVLVTRGGETQTIMAVPAKETPLGWAEPKWADMAEAKAEFVASLA